MEIKIVGLDKERTVQDRHYSGLYRVYLTLEPRPPADWGRLFAQQRAFPRHNMWREAKVQDGCIVIRCALDELERHHLKDLKEDVVATNAAYAEAVERAKAEERKRVDQDDKRNREVDEALDRLEFD